MEIKQIIQLVADASARLNLKLVAVEPDIKFGGLTLSFLRNETEIYRMILDENGYTVYSVSPAMSRGAAPILERIGSARKLEDSARIPIYAEVGDVITGVEETIVRSFASVTHSSLCKGCQQIVPLESMKTDTLCERCAGNAA